MKKQFSIVELVSEIVDTAKNTYNKYPERSDEWDNFLEISLSAEEALAFLFDKNSSSNSGYSIDEGPSERLYEVLSDDGQFTSWAKSLFDSHRDGYRKGIANTVHIAINVEELKKKTTSEEVVKHYPEFSLALINFHRRRDLYYWLIKQEEDYSKMIPNENLVFHFYLWKPDCDGGVSEYQEIYDKFDSQSSVDNVKCKTQGILNLIGLKKKLSHKYFVEAKFSSALKHLFRCWKKDKFELIIAIEDFREEIVWLDSLKLDNILNKSNPHAGCYFQAFSLSTKKYGVGNETLKKVLKSIDIEFGKVSEEPLDYWSKLFEISQKDFMSKKRRGKFFDQNTWKGYEMTGQQWLALESKGLHTYLKNYSFTAETEEELKNLPNQKGRGYQRSVVKNQEEVYVSLFLGYIERMMDCSNIDCSMKQIPPEDREYIGEIAFNQGKKTPNQKYSIMKRIVDEIKNSSNPLTSSFV